MPYLCLPAPPCRQKGDPAQAQSGTERQRHSPARDDAFLGSGERQAKAVMQGSRKKRKQTMIGIADSGSTKTEWCFLNEAGEEKRVVTGGLNPFQASRQQIRDCLEKDLYPFVNTEKVRYLYFYGSGCANPEKKLGLSLELDDFFRHADISVESDLLGAAIALCGNRPGLVAILGTGAATCWFDGEKIEQKVPSLGYVLGDEGSGARIGIRFLSDYLRGGMPAELRTGFKPLCPLPLHDIIDRVYHEPNAGRFLGELATFASGRYRNSYVHEVLLDEFGNFFQKQVLPYGKEALRGGLHVLGSTAFYGQEPLKEAAKQHGIEIRKLIKSPMDGLAAHFKPQVDKLLRKTGFESDED